MMSHLPKVAHPVAGRAMVQWVLRAASILDSATTVVVVGHGADHVRDLLPGDVLTALQIEQLGTGHAATVGFDAIPMVADDDTVVILYGDTPHLTARLVADLADLRSGEVGRLVTTRFDDPAGYGRVLRDSDGRVVGVVEDRDCTDEQRSITEVNAGLYAVRAGRLKHALSNLSDNNHQSEYYLTDIVGILSGEGDTLSAVEGSQEEVSGINSQDQLSVAQRHLRSGINQKLMESGVWMLDPDRTYIEDTVVVEPGAHIFPGVHLMGTTTVGSGARVGPDVYAVDSSIASGATVWYSVLRQAVVGEDCEVGPFASLRPGTVLEKGAKLGTFVETKNTTMGEKAKANHLAYLGDATVGARTNIGAGAITVNYDGHDKHHTEIGDDVFIGSDTMLVAPVTVGNGAMTGAGSVITKNVSAGSLAVERSEQVEIPGYSERRKARRAALNTED